MCKPSYSPWLMLQLILKCNQYYSLSLSLSLFNYIPQIIKLQSVTTHTPPKTHFIDSTENFSWSQLRWACFPFVFYDYNFDQPNYNDILQATTKFDKCQTFTFSWTKGSALWIAFSPILPFLPPSLLPFLPWGKIFLYNCHDCNDLQKSHHMKDH